MNSCTILHLNTWKHNFKVHNPELSCFVLHIKQEGSWDQSLFTLPLKGNKTYFSELTARVTPQGAMFGAVRSIKGINPGTMMPRQAGEKGKSLLQTVPEVPEQVQQVHLTADKVVVGDGELCRGLWMVTPLEEVALEQHQQSLCS